MLSKQEPTGQKWLSQKPSNIALIKYMGKLKGEQRPSNSSLSWTLPHLYSQVELVLTASERDDIWQPLSSEYPIDLSAKGLEKFLGHLKRLKQLWGIGDHFVVRSCNNFPADCGIASSASSFAALTDACVMAFTELTGQSLPLPSEVAKLSSLGSGSSCRSFFPGWVAWEQEEVRPIQNPFGDLLHMVVLVGAGTKAVSSSEAHRRIQSSPLNEGRGLRADRRLSQFLEAMTAGRWDEMYELAWADSWDMHALFETSRPPFGYFLSGSIDVLMGGRAIWQKANDGPLLTMDAGPNVHLLWRQDQKALALDFYAESLKGRWSVLSNILEIGFAQL